MTTTVHTNISSTSVDGITVLRMIMVDTGGGWGSGVGAGSLVMLSMSGRCKVDVGGRPIYKLVCNTIERISYW